MDIQTRKLEFISEFLKIQSEELVSKLENVLKNNEKLTPFTKEELIRRVEKSELDFQNGRFKSQEDLEKTSENW